MTKDVIHELGLKWVIKVSAVNEFQKRIVVYKTELGHLKHV